MNIVSVCIAAVAAPLHRGLLVALAAATLSSACAHTAPEVQTPWMSATSTSQWNDYANDLIARNGVGQVGALLTAPAPRETYMPAGR